MPLCFCWGLMTKYFLFKDEFGITANEHKKNVLIGRNSEIN